PLSARFRTVKVLGRVRHSSASSRGTKHRCWCRFGCRSRLNRVRREANFRQRSKEVNHMIQPSLSKAVCLRMVPAYLPGAQTERRGGAGPVGGLLGGKPSPAALLAAHKSGVSLPRGRSRFGTDLGPGEGGSAPPTGPPSEITCRDNFAAGPRRQPGEN